MKNHIQNTTRRSSACGIIGIIIGLVLMFAAPVQALNYTWTNTANNTSAYWTNGVMWGQAGITPYPGSAGSDVAYLTNNSSGGSYTNVLNAGLNSTYTISTLVVSNGDNGQAWLIVTNNTGATGIILTNSTFKIGTGGRLQVDNGGVVTGITSFTWAGTNGAIYLNNGGKLFTAVDFTLGSGAGGLTGLVSSVSGAGNGGVWDLNTKALNVGNSTGGNMLSVTGGAVLTNAGSITMSGNLNNLIVNNGGKLFGSGNIVFDSSSYGNTITMGDGLWNIGSAPNPSLGIGFSSNSSNNTLNVFGGLITNFNHGVYVGANNFQAIHEANYNSLIVTGGGRIVVDTGFFLVGSSLAGAVPSQTGGGNNTAILSNCVIRGLSGAVGIGAGGSNNTLTILDNTAWDNAGQSVDIGGYKPSYNNALTVSGSGAFFTNVTQISVGNNLTASGATISNKLTISNGGVISNVNRINVGGKSGATYNSLVVSNNGQLFIGANGLGVGSSYAQGVGDGNNSVLVSGGLLNNGGIAYLGTGSSNNTITIQSGGTWNQGGNGFTIGYAPSISNVVTVNGGVLTNVGALTLHGDMSGVVVTNGGKLFGTGNITFDTTDFGNSITMGGGFWTSPGQLLIGSANNSSNNAFYIVGGTVSNATSLYVGASNSGAISEANNNSLVVTNGGRFIMNSGYVYVGASIATTAADTKGGGNNTVILSNSVITVSAGSYRTDVGYGSSNNTVTLLPDASWDNKNNAVWIGTGGPAYNNVFNVSGGILTNVGNLYIGGTATGLTISNQMTVSNGGIVSNVSALQVGAASGASYNSLIVTNGGKYYQSSGAVGVGATTAGGVGGGNNTVILSNSTIISSARSYIGSGSSNNLVSLLPNTTWDLGGYILDINDNTAVSNTVAVNGGTVRGVSTLYMGLYGSASYGSLIVSNGGVMGVDAGVDIGDASTHNSSVLVTGAGSVFSNRANTIYLGGNGNSGASSSNSLTIAAGGKVIDMVASQIGQYGGGTNWALVTGNGSVWSNMAATAGSYFGVGIGTSYNSLTITDSGAVVVLGTGNTQIGNATASSNNTVLVTGQGSSWTNAMGLYVGNAGRSNVLTIANGGKVFSQGATVSAGVGAGSNVVVVTDPGSLWQLTGADSAGRLSVGLVGSDSKLIITNGGMVVTPQAFLRAANNQILVLDRGVLEANYLYGGDAAGGSISNIGGVYQFTTVSPTLDISGVGASNISITNGTISFRAINNADVTNNLGNGVLKTIKFAGANTFMLNAASNITAGQAYTFQQVAGNPSNYAGLAMINGATAYQGGGVTIGATGSLLVSNTVASFASVVTNNGVAVLVNNTSATFGGGLFNQGTITNNNTGLAVTGLFTMNNGTLVTLGAAAPTLSGTVNLQGNGTFDVSGGGLTIAGAVTNTGGITKLGTGNLTLSSANTYSGGTVINGGAVVLGNSTATGPGTVTANISGAVVFGSGTSFTMGGLAGTGGFGLTNTAGQGVALTVGNNNANTTYSGSLSGTGSLTKNGSGTLVLAGASSYSGDTYINQGQLVLANSSAAANSAVTVVPNNGLAFSNATSFTVAGLSGSGNLGLTNTGGAGIGLAVGNNGLNTTYSGVISGSGSLTKQGDGTFELTAQNTFSGTVNVSAGKLLVNGSLAGGAPLTLSANTTLAGSGTVGRVVSGAGVVSPGNSPGLLTVNQLDPSAELGFEFEFTQISPNYANLGAIGNDVLRITNATPFTVALGLSNTVNLVVTAPLTAGVLNYLRGGFYSDSGAMFDSTINGATYNLFVDDAGPLAFVHTVVETTPWGTGRILEIGVWGRMIPEPQVVMFWLTGAATLYAARRRLQRRK